MESKKITFDMSKEEQEAILKETVEKEILATHALGIPTTHGDARGVYDLYPDGRKEYIKEYKNQRNGSG
jgi:hypothetical protein